MTASTTVRFADMPAELQREVRMYGCTVAQMRDAVEERLSFTDDPAMYVISMLSDAQEMVAHGPCDSDTLVNIMEDQRQLLNRAKWILSTYVMERR